MKKLALLLLLPLAACATSTPPANVVQQTATSGGNCDPRFYGYEICVRYQPGSTGTNEHKPFVSHWDVATGRGAFLATGAEASAASTGPIPYPGTH
jgi:hypothetical protein